jgi:hypothetical protein
VRDLLDHIAAGEPSGCLKPYLLAPLLLGGPVPPRCAYRMPRSYAGNQPTSPPQLYQFILVSSYLGDTETFGDLA